MNIYQKLHGTTADRFRIGSKKQTITLTGETVGASSVILANKESVSLVASSTIFFTVYILGQGTASTAAYEIKGCYISNTNSLTGNVVNIYADEGGFTEPVIAFDSNDIMSVTCTGLANDTVKWTGVVEFIIV